MKWTFNSLLTRMKEGRNAVAILTLPLTGVICKVKVIGVFDLAFDTDQSYSKAVTVLTSALTCVKGRVKGITTFDFAFDKWQSEVKVNTCLTREVKVISIFDFAFDQDQMCNKSNFSCRAPGCTAWGQGYNSLRGNSNIGNYNSCFW